MTLADLAKERSTEETNNFLLLRLFAATLVIVGHSFAIAKTGDNYIDPLQWISRDAQFYTHRLGLFIFFVVSGFLVTGSRYNAQNVVRFIANRLLRIVPGLFVCLCACALLFGALATTLPLGEYFGSRGTWNFILVGSSLFSVNGDLPGVYFPGSRLPTAINGSLWTIPLEIRLYLIVGVCSLIRAPSKLLANLLILAVVALTIYFGNPLVDEYSDWGRRLGMLFALGAFMQVNKDRIPMRPIVLVGLIAVALLLHGTHYWYQAVGVVLAYATIFVAYARKLPLPAWVKDYSYGIYLYAFMIQQTVANAFPAITPYELMAVSIPLAWFAGYLSWRFVEGPSLSLKHRIFHRRPQLVASSPTA